MSVPKSTQMPTAITKRSEHNLSFKHLTTCDFMEFTIGGKIEMVPKQTLDISHSLFTRLEPMPVPTFGEAIIHNRCFFVPMRTIMPHFDYMKEGVVYTNTNNQSFIPSSVFMIRNTDFVKLFMREAFSTETATYGAAHDFAVVNTHDRGDISHRVLTPFGRRVLKLLYSLGYRIDFSLINTESYHTALHLFAAAKVYYDWYYPTQYTYDDRSQSVLHWFNYDKTSEEFLEEFGVQELEEFVNFLDRVCYDTDYITAAWDNPVSPSDGAYSDIFFGDATNDETLSAASYVSTDSSNGTPLLASFANPASISQYLVDALKALTDYVKRNQLVGSRLLDRYMARFGISLSSEKLRRSQFVGEFTQQIDFGDVTSTSDTDGAQLGAYAGKGYSYGVGGYSYTSSDYGYLIFVTSIVPLANYYQGQDRSTMHLTSLDFWTPEFDNLGVQAMSTREVFVPLDGDASYAGTSGDMDSFDWDDCVYGFVPRYAEYKRGYDNVTGDYILGSKNATRTAWTTFRDLSPLYANKGIPNIHHDIDVVQGSDADQYNRIFYYTGKDADHFNVRHIFKVKSSFPGASLWDTYEFEDEDKAQKVKVDVNGVKAN